MVSHKKLHAIIFITVISSIIYLIYYRSNFVVSELDSAKQNSTTYLITHQSDCAKSLWTTLKDVSDPSKYRYKIYDDGMVHYSVSGGKDWVVSTTSVDFFVLNDQISSGLDLAISRSQNEVFWYGNILIGADPTTFYPAMGKSCEFLGYYQDKTHVYRYVPERTGSGQLTGGIDLSSDIDVVRN